MQSLFIFFVSACLSFAAKAQTPVPKTDTASIPLKKATYTCTMHPEVVSDKPGKCPKCGMKLTVAKTYICPMDRDVISNKPGKCPKCKMQVVEAKP